MGVISYIRNSLSLGDRLAEFFYGVTMVAAVSGMINSLLPPTETKILYLLYAALAVNITWGLIDGITGIYADLADTAQNVKLADALRKDREDRTKRDAVLGTMQGTLMSDLDRYDQEAIVDKIAAVKPAGRREYFLSLDDVNIAAAIFLIDFILVFPVIFPFFVFQNVGTAVFVSHAIAIVSLATCAMIWAWHLGKNIILTGLIIALIAMAGISVTYYSGW